LQLIDKGTALGWALNAYDAAAIHRKDKKEAMSLGDKKKLLGTLITDQEIRSLVASSSPSSSTKKSNFLSLSRNER
jgi:hypothetical protein